jgi:transcriptional regulator with XRE-family HTH domain
MRLNSLAISLKTLRKLHDMTQTELSTKLGVSLSYICKIESGQKHPNIELLIQYADVYKIKLSTIIIFTEFIESLMPLPILFMDYAMIYDFIINKTNCLDGDIRKYIDHYR